MSADDYWWDQRYEDALFAELGEEEYLRRQPSPARWVATPGDDRQHRSSNDCPCTPIVWVGGAVEHR